MLDSGLLNEAGLEGLHGDPDALRAPVGGADPHLLEVRAELALRDARHVRTDAATLLGLAFTVNDAPFDGATTCDYANFGHGEMS